MADGATGGAYVHNGCTFIYEWTIYSSTAVVVGVQDYCMGMVFGLSPSDRVGWCKWTPATTAVHNLL